MNFKFHPNNRGFSLVEVLLAIAIFAMLLAAFVGALFYGQESVTLSGSRNRAIFLAEEGLEALRNIRDDDFLNLTDGTYGLTASGGQWDFSGISDITDIYIRQIEISPIDNDTKQITSTITWDQNSQRQGSIALVAYLTDWQTLPVTQSDTFVIDGSGATLSGDQSMITGITFENSGSRDAIIDLIKISWTGVSPSPKIHQIKIGGDAIWSGNRNSDVLIDITDFNITAGDGPYTIDHLDFQADMTGATINILLTFIDGSTKEETGIIVN